MIEPLISVLVANFNRANFIADTIESVLNQSYTSFELVIVDDGSTDLSIDVISKYQKLDSRVKVHRHEVNQGCGAAMRKCADLSTGEILCLVGSDDVLDANALQTMADAHARFPDCSVIHSTHYVCDEDLKPLRLAYGAVAIPAGESYLSYGKGITSLASFTRKHYRLTAGIDASFKRAVDQDLYYKMEEVGKILFVDQPLYKYRVNSKGISTFRNISKARYWFGLAKENAFQRRTIKPSVKNIDKKELDAWWSLVFASKAGDSFRSLKLVPAFCWLSKAVRKSSFDRYTIIKIQALFLGSLPHRLYQEWKK